MYVFVNYTLPEIFGCNTRKGLEWNPHEPIKKFACFAEHISIIDPNAKLSLRAQASVTL